MTLVQSFFCVFLSSLTMAGTGCSGKNAGPPPKHHGSFFRTNWRDLYNAPSKKTHNLPATVSESKKNDGILFPRESIVREALKLYHGKKAANHLGAPDVYAVFKQAGFSQCLSVTDDAPDIVKKATRANAYFTGERPKAGDLIFFHNQYDRNQNGKSDDWFTGVAIVIEAGRRTHTAVTRTGGVPRLVKISPEGPMVRLYRDKPVNSYVKIPGVHDPRDAQYLAGQLYAGFVNTEAFVGACSLQLQ